MLMNILLVFVTVVLIRHKFNSQVPGHPVPILISVDKAYLYLTTVVNLVIVLCVNYERRKKLNDEC